MPDNEALHNRSVPSQSRAAARPSGTAPSAAPGTPATLPDAGRAPGKGAERRRNPRIRLPRGFLALIGLPGVDQTTAVSPRDLSRTGIGFYHSADLEPGFRCTMTLKALGGELVQIQSRVVRRRQVRTGVFDIGVEFEREIDTQRFVADQSVSRLAPPPTPRSAAEARAHIADLAAAMKKMAEAEAPLNDLFDKIDELARLCDSARPAGE